MNPVIDLLENRVSVRKFSEKIIGEVEENIIIHAALRAPSTSNRRFSPDELDDCFASFSCPSGNRFHAENKAQYSYITKYSTDELFREAARSVREVQKNWKGEYIPE